MEHIDFKNDSQSLAKCLRELDLELITVYNSNKMRTENVDYKPEIIIYLGDKQRCAIRSLAANNSESSSTDKYRGFHIIPVTRYNHCAVFCLNPQEL